MTIANIKKTLKKLGEYPVVRGEWKSGRVYLIPSKGFSEIEILPDESLAVVNHSPTGFAWGYGGSGPAQLSLALLLILIDVEDALRLYQKFKWEVVSKLPQQDFELSYAEVTKWVNKYE